MGLFKPVFLKFVTLWFTDYYKLNMQKQLFLAPKRPLLADNLLA